MEEEEPIQSRDLAAIDNHGDGNGVYGRCNWENETSTITGFLSISIINDYAML